MGGVYFAYMGKRNPFTDWAQFFLGERYPWRNQARQIWWRSLKGFRGSCGSNFSISHWLCRSSLQQSHTTVWACDNSHDNVYGAVIMTKVIERVHPVHLMSLTCSKLYYISVTVPQDNGMTKRMVGPIYLTLGRGKHPTARCVTATLITVHQLCMLDIEHIVSTVKCEFNSQKCYSVDCCFVLGWWVQCHVLCQQ